MIGALDVQTLAENWGVLLLSVSLKALVLLVLAVAGARVLRRAAASTRHLLWTAAVVGLLCLPVLEVALPGWSIDGIGVPARDASTQEVAATPWPGPTDPLPVEVTPARLHFVPDTISFPDPTATADPAPGLVERVLEPVRAWSPWVWALLLWECGVLLVAGRLLVGRWQVRALERRSRVVDDPTWRDLAARAADEVGLRRVPPLLTTRASLTPLTWGITRPKVLLPADANTWSTERRLDVLRHEFAHVQRRDVLTQVLAQIGCALFWFHPLPWITAARMRLERERACDDRVLLAGSRASTYAGHLLDMARTLRADSRLATASIGMARRSELGERMDSLLDDGPRSRRTARTARLALVGLALFLLVPLAMLEPDALEAAPPDPPRAVEVEGPFAVEAPAPRAPLAPTVAGRVLVRGDRMDLRVRDHVLFESGGDELEVVTRHGEWTYRRDDFELEVQMDGRLRFADDESDVELLDDGSYFDLRAERDGERHRMEIERDRDGRVERTYFENGRSTEVDDDARAWFSEALSTFMVQAGIGTDARIGRWLDEGGVGTAVGRIEALESDHAAARHWSALLRHPSLSDEDRERVLAEIPRSIDSDFEKARVVTDNLELLLADPDLGDGVAGLIGSLDSDFERGRALRMAIELGDLDPSVLSRLLVLTDDLDSDFEKARVLALMSRDDLRDGRLEGTFFEVADGMDSDFEKTRVLVDALPLALDDPDARAEMWRTIEDIDSDFEKARLVAALAPRLGDDETMVIEALDVVATIDSDFEKARALRAFVDAAAGSEPVREAFLRTAETIDSDHEYGRVVRELSRAGR